MRKIFLLSLFACSLLGCETQLETEWVRTTETIHWKSIDDHELLSESTSFDVEIFLDKEQQTIEGFGSCFNELGWTSLSELKIEDRESIMRELFAPETGANFTVCRMPIAANDFARNWYSYNEEEGDFAMENFSIDNDLETLIPFINNAKKYNPDLKIWASPWSPPSWMKYNKHYASRSSVGMVEMVKKIIEQRRAQGDTVELGGFFSKVTDPKYQNDLPADPNRQGIEGTDMFIQEDKYLKAYALYFQKFIDGYKEQGIDISMVMPQNEFNSAQVFPSCCWTAKGLANFIGSYLGTAMEEKGVEIYIGTMERPAEALVDTIIQDDKSGRYIKGIGFQWAGKDALPGINNKYSDLNMYQTEQECGDGKNDWKGAMHSWDLMKHYLNNGVSVYEYWNTSLLEGGISRWGWAQNSLVVVDAEKKNYRYSVEYYIMKHVSHYVMSGAKKLDTQGEYDDLLVFKNPDASLVIIVANQNDESRNIHIKVEDKILSPELKANSVNTIKVKSDV